MVIKADAAGLWEQIADPTQMTRWFAWVFDHIVTRGKSFADFQRLNIRRTLTAMKDDVEKR
ncbi:hypothetical protein [Brevibacterium permense]|uniref:hypothetical protein n=1 Tax=Brevibacterium permense TaxID=234834 RepID=UPI0021CE8680|nr:hypothetical protein [Brevibacterium permense]